MATGEQKTKKGLGKKASDVGVWVILVLLIIGLMGFSAGSFGGGQQIIGRAGDKPIAAQDYFSSLQTEIRSFEQRIGRGVPFAEAQSLGLQQQALSQLVGERALDDEAEDLGLSLGDARLRDQVVSLPAFQGLTGGFDRALYGEALRRSGLSETRFEEQLRDQAARELLQAAVVSGIEAPAGFAETLVAFAGETRDFTFARLVPDDLSAPLPAPSDEALVAEYEANAASYTLPETRRITYAWRTPAMILDDVEVDEQALRDLYEDRRAEFVTPERRLVERLVYPDAEAAEAAKAAIEREELTFEAAVAARGLDLEDADMGDVERGDLGAAAGAVFNAAPPAIVGPFETDLGPALFRVNAILPAREVPFEQARATLRDALALDRARRVLDAEIDPLNDELAAGATLEELAEAGALELGTIDYFPGVDADIAAYEAFRAAASDVDEDDFPEVAKLEDGGLFAIRLDEVIAPRLQPLDEVRPAVAAAWETAETTRRLAARAERLAEQARGGLTFVDLGLDAQEEVDIRRDGFVPGTPAALLSDVFALDAPGEVAVVEGTGEVLLVRLDSVTEADLADPDTVALAEALRAQIAQSYAGDLYQTFTQGVVAGTDIDLDQAMISGIHAQFQ
ncbi:MAG: peptidyl-prolyl cis-trans isomerase [Shimia sp.]